MLWEPQARSTGAKTLSLPAATSPPRPQPHHRAHPSSSTVQARLSGVSPQVTSPCLTVLHFSISSRISGFTFSIMSTSCWLLFSIPCTTNTLVPWKPSSYSLNLRYLEVGSSSPLWLLVTRTGPGTTDSGLSGSELGYECLGLVPSKN